MEKPISLQEEELRLIQRCQDGEVEAFDMLVRHYQNKIFAIALGMLGDYDAAQDAAEETFVRAYQAIKKFRREAKFSTWLNTIVINLCRQQRRWWARRKKLFAGSLDEMIETQDGEMKGQVTDGSPNPKEKAMESELKRVVYGAVKSLDKRSRAMVVMHDIQGLSYEEIAEVLHCPQGTVKSGLNRARLRLKEMLKGKMPL